MESFLSWMLVLHAILAARFAVGVIKTRGSLEHLVLTEEVAAEEGIDLPSTVDAQKAMRLSIFHDSILVVGCLAWVAFWFLNIDHVVLAICSMVVPSAFVVGAIRIWLDVRR